MRKCSVCGQTAQITSLCLDVNYCATCQDAHLEDHNIDCLACKGKTLWQEREKWKSVQKEAENRLQKKQINIEANDLHEIFSLLDAEIKELNTATAFVSVYEALYRRAQKMLNAWTSGESPSQRSKRMRSGDNVNNETTTEDVDTGQTSEDLLTMQPSSTPTRDASYSCTWKGCKVRFSTKEEQRKHYTNLHETERPWVCDWEGCVKDYTNESHLKRHKTDKSHWYASRQNCDT
eukprot:CFRG3703T1